MFALGRKSAITIIHLDSSKQAPSNKAHCSLHSQQIAVVVEKVTSIVYRKHSEEVVCENLCNLFTQGTGV